MLLLHQHAKQLVEQSAEYGIGREQFLDVDAELRRIMALAIACRHFNRQLREMHGREAN